MKIFERITTAFSLIILAVCCVAFLLFGISATGWKALSIPTGSMRPTIPPGSLVLVHRVPISSLKVGDVITYISPLNSRITISHRIVKEYLINNKVPAFITKGDANKTSDRPISEGSVQGQVVWHLPNVGYWLLDAKKPLIILPIIYFASLIIMAEEVKRLSDYYKISQPYHIYKFKSIEQQSSFLSQKLGVGVAITTLIVVIVFAFGSSRVEALLKSNVVTLANNTLTVARTKQCSGNTSNNTSISINDNSTQTATSGNVSNDSGGNATSGNATNNNSSNINVTVTNC